MKTILKEIYKCGICERCFDDETTCLRHEELCATRKACPHYEMKIIHEYDPIVGEHDDSNIRMKCDCGINILLSIDILVNLLRMNKKETKVIIDSFYENYYKNNNLML